MTSLLTRYPVVATTDLDRARAEVAAVFCPHELTVLGRSGRLDVVHNAAPVAGIGLNYLRYGEEVRITPGTFDTFYLMQIPLAGRARIKVGDRVVASDRGYASLPSPTEPVDMIWSADCEQLMVYLRRDAIEAYAASNGPGDAPLPVVFDPLVNLNAPALRSWLRLVRVAREELEQGGGVLTAPLAATHFEQVLIAGLLMAQPNSSGLAAAAPAGATTSRAVRAAVELIEAQPERAWRVAELAAEVGVSSRTLQEAFHRERGVSPLEELRRARLARARADLLDGTRESTTVTEIASRWGFFHLGRFSQVYRETHGESPSETLAR